MENPKVYISLSAALKKADLLDCLYPEYEIDLTFWIHPDFNIPIEKYQKMTGIRYPGSPKR
jgi:hypothetical protein